MSGQVRISVPTTYGHYRRPEMLGRFTDAFPDVRIELSVTNRNVDLVAEGYDLAIRLGPLPIVRWWRADWRMHHCGWLRPRDILNVLVPRQASRT